MNGEPPQAPTPTRGPISGWVIALAAIGTLLLIGLGYYVMTYNALVGLDEGVKGAWGNVETSYQRRLDLVPNLIRTVKGAKDFEAKTLLAVVNARTRAAKTNLKADQLGDPAQVQKFRQAQSQLTSAVSRMLNIVVERYPQLRATENFRDLQVQLEGTENRINVARTRYNEAARAYNAKRRGFFARMVADSYGFKAVEYFKADLQAASAPTVSFD